MRKPTLPTDYHFPLVNKHLDRLPWTTEPFPQLIIPIIPRLFHTHPGFLTHIPHKHAKKHTQGLITSPSIPTIDRLLPFRIYSGPLLDRYAVRDEPQNGRYGYQWRRWNIGLCPALSTTATPTRRKRRVDQSMLFPVMVLLFFYSCPVSSLPALLYLSRLWAPD